jgi:hypothetical protein
VVGPDDFGQFGDGCGDPWVFCVGVAWREFGGQLSGVFWGFCLEVGHVVGHQQADGVGQPLWCPDEIEQLFGGLDSCLVVSRADDGHAVLVFFPCARCGGGFAQVVAEASQSEFPPGFRVEGWPVGAVVEGLDDQGGVG